MSFLLKIRLTLHKRRLLKLAHGGEKLHLEGCISVIAAEKLVLGVNVHLWANCYLNCTGGVQIGDYSIVSRNVTIYSYNHDFKGKEMLPYGPGKILRPVTIGKYVWVGMNAAISPGTTIGDGAVIGLNTTVSGEIPKNAVVVGAKPRIIGYRDARETAILAERNQFYAKRVRGEQ